MKNTLYAQVRLATELKEHQQEANKLFLELDSDSGVREKLLKELNETSRIFKSLYTITKSKSIEAQAKEIEYRIKFIKSGGRMDVSKISLKKENFEDAVEQFLPACHKDRNVAKSMVNWLIYVKASQEN